jgi:hypothetical protein
LQTNNSDHLPISLSINWEWTASTPIRKRLWSKTDTVVLRLTVQEGIARGCGAAELRNKNDIDNFVSSIVEAREVNDWKTPHELFVPRNEAKYITSSRVWL